MSAVPTQAAVIFDNITGTSSPGGYLVGFYDTVGTFAIGFDFAMPAGGAAPIVGGAIGVSYGSGKNQMDLAIAEDNGGAVGPVVATAILTHIPADLAILDFTLSSPVMLTPGASYWLLASMDDPSAIAYWWTPDVPPGVYDQTGSLNGGPFITGTNARPGQFAILSAPEPSTWAMLALGFGGLAVLSRPRRLRLAI